ncbi:MAG: hypothetical protein V7637_2909, partial [Mycobacteriales bacterium]
MRPGGHSYTRQVLVGRDVEAAALAKALATPGRAVVAGPPGIGESAVYAISLGVARAGALATLRHRRGLPMTRALRAPVPPDDVPPDDVPPAVEAAGVRPRDRVPLIDDVHWADPYTLAVLRALPPYRRVVATVRAPWPGLPASRSAAGWWLDVPARPPAGTVAVVRSVPPGLLVDPGGVARPLVRATRAAWASGDAAAVRQAAGTRTRTEAAVLAAHPDAITRPDPDAGPGTITRPDPDAGPGTITRPDPDAGPGTITRPDPDAGPGTITRPD